MSGEGSPDGELDPGEEAAELKEIPQGEEEEGDVGEETADRNAPGGEDGVVEDTADQNEIVAQNEQYSSPEREDDIGEEGKDDVENSQPLDDGDYVTFGEGVGASPPPPDEEDEEDLDDEMKNVDSDLRDAVEGNFRLKRMLFDEDDDAPDAKRPKVKENPKIYQLLAKWGATDDLVVRHILSSCSDETLSQLVGSNYHLERHNHTRSYTELLHRRVMDLCERTLPPRGTLDTIGSFCERWKLLSDAPHKLRALSHRDLRYVFAEYDGSTKLADVISAAPAAAPKDVPLTVGAAPHESGLMAISRFNRLELIDPLADGAVFGDANLSFSRNLARHRTALGHVGRVIATTFEELETLRERYAEVDTVIEELESHFAEVYHGVDCTRIGIDPRFDGLRGSLGAVYYNYPHSGAVGGFFDGHPMVNWRHENLMRLFFRALRSFTKPGGSVKVSSNMSAVGVRYSYIIGSAIENEFVHTETMPFLEWHLHRYGRSYGDKRDMRKRLDAKNNESYNAQRADADMVYCFRYQPSGKTLEKQQVRLPPTLKVLMACNEGPFDGNRSRENKLKTARQIHKRFVTELSGTHVG
jgi:hypothetical protein